MLVRPAAPPVIVPPRALRLRFWVLGLRLPEPYRPWAAQQITDPQYLRRRSVGMLGLLVFWVPALALLTAGDGSVFLLAGPVGVVLGALLQARRPLRPSQRDLLLAYQGVTAHGRLVTPLTWRQTMVRAGGGNPLGTVGLVLFVAQLLLVGSGAAVVFDHYAASDRCRSVPAETAQTVRVTLGRPIPNDPRPTDDLGVGATLRDLREVHTTFPGITYVAAQVRSADGQDLGPAMWRVIAAGATFDLPTPSVDAGNALAHRLSPSSGFFTATSDAAADKALECSRKA